MTRTRTNIALASVLLLAPTIAACSADADGAGSAGSGRPTIGMQFSLTGIEFFSTVRQGAEDGADDGDVNVRITGPASLQPDLAVRQFKDLQAQTDPYIGVHPAPPDFWVRPITEASKAGENLITFSDAPAEGTEAATYVGDNGYRSGRVMVTEILKSINADTGEVVVGNCIPGFPTLDSRIEGMVDQFEESAPNLEIVTADVGIEPAENLGNWQNLVATHPDAIAFLGNCDTSGPNLVKVKKERSADWLTGTFDLSKGTLDGVADGTMTLAVGGSPYMIGYLTTRLLAAQANGEDVPSGWYQTGAEIVNADNIKEIQDRESSAANLRAYYAPIVKDYFADLSKITVRPIDEASDQLDADSNDEVPWLSK